jgi:peroxiredoxin
MRQHADSSADPVSPPDKLKSMASIKQKAMLSANDPAPDFQLEDLSGVRRTRTVGEPTLLAFFKVSCPVCQFAFPFLERLYRGKSNNHIAMYAISQDDAKSTRAFHSEFGITLPTLLDKEEEGYPASNAYGISHVPSLFLIEPDGRISLTMMGFEKKAMQELGKRLGKDPFEPGEYVPEWKSG